MFLISIQFWFWSVRLPQSRTYMFVRSEGNRRRWSITSFRFWIELTMKEKIYYFHAFVTSNINNFKGQSCSPFIRKMSKDVTGYLCCVLEECRVRKWEPLFCLCTEVGKQLASSSALWAFCCWYCNRSDWQVTATVKPQPSTFCSHPALETKLNKAAKKNHLK